MNSRRKKLTPMQRDTLMRVHDSKCHICHEVIPDGSPWHDEHIKPLWNGGSDGLENRAPACLPCHFAKTTREHGERAHGRNVRSRHQDHMLRMAEKEAGMSARPVSRWRRPW